MKVKSCYGVVEIDGHRTFLKDRFSDLYGQWGGKGRGVYRHGNTLLTAREAAYLLEALDPNEHGCSEEMLAVFAAYAFTEGVAEDAVRNLRQQGHPMMWRALPGLPLEAADTVRSVHALSASKNKVTGVCEVVVQRLLGAATRRWTETRLDDPPWVVKTPA